MASNRYGDGEGPQWAPRWSGGVLRRASRDEAVVRRYAQLHALGGQRVDYDPYRVRQGETDERAAVGVLCGGDMSHLERGACWRTDGDAELAAHPGSVGARHDPRRVKVCYFTDCGKPLYCVRYRFDELMRHAWGWDVFPHTNAPIDADAREALDVANMGMSHLDEFAAVREDCAGAAGGADAALWAEVRAYLYAEAERLDDATSSYRRRAYDSEDEAAAAHLGRVRNQLVREYLAAYAAEKPDAAKAAATRLMLEAQARGATADNFGHLVEAAWPPEADSGDEESDEEESAAAANWWRLRRPTRDEVGRRIDAAAVSALATARRARDRASAYLFGDRDSDDDEYDDGSSSSDSDDDDDEYDEYGR